jgi:BirA family biotin operon repressor/biotin-[acetyl-CoA-carboxylase] ligase
MIYRFLTLDSTMTEAQRLAAEGCPHLTAVVAEEQTAGRGRHGRAWHSARGEGLYVTVVLRLDLGPEDLPAITLALGLATAAAITDVADVVCDLRWPNDVLVNGKKCAGVLTELHGGAILAGIGVNANQISFPEDLADIATSLRIATGKPASLDVLLASLLARVDEITGLLQQQGREPVLRLFEQASSYVRGKRVTVESPSEQVVGVTEGLDASGFLWLRRDDGERITIRAGGVRPAASLCS